MIRQDSVPITAKRGVLVSGHIRPGTYLQVGGLEIRYHNGSVTISLPGRLELTVNPLDAERAMIVAEAVDVYPKLQIEESHGPAR